MNLKQCYTTLEIHENATTEEIRQAYRDLVNIWHPDRYLGNPRLQDKANEKLKELNAAYEMLKANRREDPNHPTRHRRSPGARAGKHTATQARKPVGPLKRKHPFVIWIILLAALAITALALYSRWPFLWPGQEWQNPLADNESSIHTLATAQLDALQIAELQRALILMGYNSGPADGRMGPKTIRAVQQFSIDFKMSRKGDFVITLLAESSRQVSITRIHADWPAVAKSQDFNDWIENQNITSPTICRGVIASGSTAQVVNLVTAYTFHRDQPAPEKLPPSAIRSRDFYRGIAPLTLKVRNAGQHFFVKLIDLPANKEVLSLFLRSGAQLKVNLPLGTYELKYAAGETWYGPGWLFGNATTFSRLDTELAFEHTDNEISGYSVDLYLQPAASSGDKGKDYDFTF